MTTLDVGDTYHLDFTIRDPDDGTLTDATLALTVTDPSGNDTTPSVTRDATGLYHADFLLDSAGVWYWHLDVSGAVTEVQDGQVSAQNPAPTTYVSLALLRLNLGLPSNDTTRDELLALHLRAATRAVEKYCATEFGPRVFYLARAATPRVFSACDKVICTEQGDRLNIADVGSLDDLVVELGDGTTWTAVTGYETYPDNALERGRPVTGIVFPWTSSSRPQWHRKARVTARWGWPEIPDDVTEATLLQATRLSKRPSSPEGTAGSADWGLIQIPNLDPDVKRLLADYTVGLLVA